MTPSRLLLDVERSLGPDASRTHISFPFVLETEPESIEVGFSYDPKTLADERLVRELAEAGIRRYGYSGEDDAAGVTLRNLLTLSLDDPAGFRGCAHRHGLSGVVLVTALAATPGFLPGPLPAGRWLVTVSVHLVVTDRCTFVLQVRVP